MTTSAALQIVFTLLAACGAAWAMESHGVSIYEPATRRRALAIVAGCAMLIAAGFAAINAYL